VRDNEAAAAAMGVDVRRIKAGAFVVSSAYAGLAGVMLALWLDLVKPDENEFTGNYSLTVSIAFLAIDRLVGNRVRSEEELRGLDVAEMGMEGYYDASARGPAFITGTQPALPRPSAGAPAPQLWAAAEPFRR